MTQDKILFLMFPFIFDGFSVRFIESNYEDLVVELPIEQAWVFSAIFDHFKSDKIDIKNGNVKFSHPSYSEAIKYIIYDRRYRTTNSRSLLEKVLVKIAKYNIYDYNLAIFRIIIDNFDNTNDQIRNLLFDLAAGSNFAWIIRSNFDKIPQEVRNELLLKIVPSEYYEIERFVSDILYSNFDKIPQEVRNELLLKVRKEQESMKE